MTSRNNDMRRISGALSNLEGSSDQYDTSAKLAAVTIIRQTHRFAVPALNANASNVVAANASPQIRAIANGRVLGAYFLPTAAAVAHASNNAQIGVVQLYANGSPKATALATANTAPTANGGVGSLAAGTAVALTVASGANARFTKGTVIAPQLTQNASGVALAAGTVQIDIELEGPASDYPY